MTALQRNYYKLIIDGDRRFSQAPKSYRQILADELIKNGYEHLIDLPEYLPKKEEVEDIDPEMTVDDITIE